MRSSMHLNPMPKLALAFSILFLLACVSPSLALAQESNDDVNAVMDNAALQRATLATQGTATLGDGTPIASGEIDTCTWVIDANGKLTVSPQTGNTGSMNYNPDPTVAAYPPWYPYADKITSAEFTGTISLARESGRLFYECQNLEQVDLSNLDTSHTTSLALMFYNCRTLTSIDMSMLDVSAVQYVQNMFDCCVKLADLKLPDFSNSKIDTATAMFMHCQSLTTIDLSTIDTSNIRLAHNLFFGCTSLQKVIVGDKWDLPGRASSFQADYEGFNTLFSNCNALVGANGTSFATAKVNNVAYARIDTPENPGYFWPAKLASGEIGTCTWVIDANGKLTISPTQGDVGSLVLSYDAPWYPHAKQITSAEIQGTISITGNLCPMFLGCENLVDVNLTGLDTSGLTVFDQMFEDCKNLTSVDLSPLDASSITSTRCMFQRCAKLASISLPDFNNSELTAIAGMFASCFSLKQINLSTVDTSSVQFAELLFGNCNALEKVIVGDKWDLYQHEPLPNYDECVGMFTGCLSLIGANGTSFVDKLDSGRTYARIDTPENPGYFWPADNGSGNGDDNGNGQGSGGDNGEGGGNNTGGNGSNSGSGNTSNESSSSNGSGNTGNNNSSGSSTNRQPTLTTTKAQSNPIVTLSVSTYVFNGKVRTPSVTVKLGGKTLKSKQDYTVSYAKGRKAIGTYEVTVTGKGSYKFKASKSFRIIPKTPKLISLKAHKNSDGSSGFITSWKKVGNKTIGYEIRWSPAKTFKKTESFAFRGSTPFAKKGSAALQVKTRAWLGKKTFVQIRAFKIVKGKKYYSKWSKAKKVRLKK